MLSNFFSAKELSSLLRRKRLPYHQMTVSLTQVDQHIASGWSLIKRNQKTVQIKQEKSHDQMFEDRIWSLLFRMGFSSISGTGGVKLDLMETNTRHHNQIDILAADDEVAIAIEAKSAKSPKRYDQLQEDLGKFSLLRERLIKELKPIRGASVQLGMVLFVNNLHLTTADQERAAQAGIALLTERELKYLESLVDIVGAAARFQLLAEVFSSRTIKGLQIVLPAVQVKQGNLQAYLFCIRPDYLLKIAFVSHRAIGGADDVDTYQRMLNKNKIRKIREYISDGNMFPTNLVVNLKNFKHVRFEKSKSESDEEGGHYGLLHVTPSYKAAWIIDGQHRLYAFANHEFASTSFIYVLAFVGLPASKQAQLFIDINNEQKSVSRSLLQELYAELRWDSEDEAERISAVISKAIQVMDADPNSPFYGRISKSDDKKSLTRCISVTSVFSELERSEFYLQARQKAKTIEYGPLFDHDQSKCLARTAKIISTWFLHFSKANSEWWEAGSGDGGGLAMNDSVMGCLKLLRSVIDHLEKSGLRLVTKTPDEVCRIFAPYAELAAQHLAALNDEERKNYRSLRGGTGHTVRMRTMQEAIYKEISAFTPPGLLDYLKLRDADTQRQAHTLITEIEAILQAHTISELKSEFGIENDVWFYEGIPHTIRKKVLDRINESKGQSGSYEQNLDLIDYQPIILQNWRIFEQIFSIGKTGRKENRTHWIVEVNEIRKIVMHASRGKLVSFEQLAKLEDYSRELVAKLSSE